MEIMMATSDKGNSSRRTAMLKEGTKKSIITALLAFVTEAERREKELFLTYTGRMPVGSGS